MTQAAYPDPLPRDQMRASHADRQLVVDALRRSHDEGRLTLGEFDDRSRDAYAALTYADLAALTADLPVQDRPLALRSPAPVVPAVDTAPAVVEDDDRTPLMWRVVGSAWFAVTFINLVIWGIVSIAGADWVYPWWVWVGGPWGAVLLVGWLSGLGRGKRDS